MVHKFKTVLTVRLKNGFKLKKLFKLSKIIKKVKCKTLYSYGILSNGLSLWRKKFVKKCKQVGVNGLIIVDLPWPDNKKFAKLCKKNSITFVQLISPTTSKERMKKIIRDCHDLNYLISMLSTTGGKLKGSPKKILENNKIKRINKSKNILWLDLGITNKNIGSFKNADGLVVGSALCNKIKVGYEKIVKILS